jgi:hypothetical protein
MTYTKEMIQEKLSSDPRWIERGLIVLYNRQTEDEKTSENTKWDNGMGFNGTDSRYLSYCSRWILKGNHLTGHHLEKVGKKLPKYWGQIMEEIEKRGN